MPVSFIAVLMCLNFISCSTVYVLCLGQWLLKYMQAVVLRRRQGDCGTTGAAFAAALTFTADSSDAPLSPEEVRHLSTLLQRLSHTGKSMVYFCLFVCVGVCVCVCVCGCV
jgi:hypothetical protein